MNQRAFSLVEVTLSLGLVAFCLVSLLGLMPVGLGATSRAGRQAEAARLMEQLASAIHGAVETGDGEFALIDTGGVGQLGWEIAGEAVALQGTLTASGDAVTPVNPAVFAYRISLVPPDSTRPSAFGRAIVSVVWPAAAEFTAGSEWNDGTWSGQQGEMNALVIFRPE